MAKKGLGGSSSSGEAVITCISEEVKASLLDMLDMYGEEVVQAYAEVIESIPICFSGNFVESRSSEEASGGAKTSKKSRKGSKGASAYQQFMSECMKARNAENPGKAPDNMKGCAAEWTSAKR